MTTRAGFLKALLRGAGGMVVAPDLLAEMLAHRKVWPGWTAPGTVIRTDIDRINSLADRIYAELWTKWCAMEIKHFGSPGTLSDRVAMREFTVAPEQRIYRRVAVRLEA